jgi:hypothetical protein
MPSRVWQEVSNWPQCALRRLPLNERRSPIDFDSEDYVPPSHVRLMRFGIDEMRDVPSN